MTRRLAPSSSMCWCMRSAIISACRTPIWRPSRNLPNKQRKLSDESEWRVRLRCDHDRSGGRSGKDASVSLQRLPDRNRHRLSRFAPGARCNAEGEWESQDLHQDHRRERPAARAGILRAMRLAALFDDAGRRRTGRLCAARRHFAPARPAHAAAANLVAFGAAVGDAACDPAETRKAKLKGRKTMIVTVFRSRLKPGLREE